MSASPCITSLNAEDELGILNIRNLKPWKFENVGNGKYICNYEIRLLDFIQQKFNRGKSAADDLLYPVVLCLHQPTPACP